MTRKLLLGVALIGLVSCVKEGVTPVDFSCQVNGRQWQMNNPALPLGKSGYRIVGSHNAGDSSTIFIEAQADEGNEVILGSLSIEIHDFKGVGTYTSNTMKAFASAVTSRHDNFTTYNTYILDQSKPFKVIVQEYTADRTIKGVFTIPLVVEFGPDGVNPDHLTVSSGRFNCPDKFWH